VTPTTGASPTPDPARELFTLAIDCGGSGIKASVLDSRATLHAPAIRVPTPYPLPPERLIETIAEIAAGLPPAQRVTVGMPGMIRHGVVVATPHYIRANGPHTRLDPALADAWAGFDMQAGVAARLGFPTLVLNDAEVHGAGVISGTGLELVLTLGTGLGSALFDGGGLAPHLEMSHAPVRWGTTYDDWIGEHERARMGDALWSRRIRRMVEGFEPVFRWDRLYIGGGNSRRITASTLAKLGDAIVIVPNQAGIVGGVRAWTLQRA